MTVKDHTEGFPHKLLFRLIHPSKSDKGKISKNLQNKVNKLLILNANVNQWKNTTTVIDWFKSVAIKKLQLHPVRCGKLLPINFVKLIQ